MTPPIRLMVADVDGTLVTHDKVLTDRAIEAVRALHAAGILFAHSGLSIVMGNASMQVQRAAHRITTSNDDEGFANAVQRYVLPRG
jgi:hydroxymethylpyrimidine pyrophosphatase-like HAD family hydrolase